MVTFLYLDQNYASRIAKFLLGQPHHEHFGRLYQILLQSDLLIPPSPFHVLELQEGYLLPVFQEFFPRFSQGYWVRPWQEVLSLQRQSEQRRPLDLLTRHGNWNQPADLSPLESIVDLPLAGTFQQRIHSAEESILALLHLENHPHGAALPFVYVLSRLLAFRSLNEERQPHASDLADLLIAATVRPYVPLLATDRFVCEGLRRSALGEGVFSGRRHEVLRLQQWLQP